jgi:hypothetical protein
MNQITEQQFSAIRDWQQTRGRTWKAALRQAWMTGNYGGFHKANILQGLRNTFGPSWLASFKFSAPNVACDVAKTNFSPYDKLIELGGEPDTSGINWSHAKFPSQRAMAVFIAECNNHGYRTRYEREQAGFWLVQYHHYED